MNPVAPSYYRYLPVDPDALRWGIYVMDAGHMETPPHAPYPAGGHPDAYLFSWEQGRVLNEYQLVYLSRGAGVFESRATGAVPVAAGHFFFLFPGVWHRYRPDEQTGWHEHWVGFSGDFADRIMRDFFSPARAVMPAGSEPDIVHLIDSIAGLMRHAPPGYQQIMGARVMEVVALARSSAISGRAASRETALRIQEAKRRLLHAGTGPVDMRRVARELGMSYSRFRSLFRKETGTSPQHYLIDIRINKACHFLRLSDAPVSDIAFRTGFSSPYYFSRLFKQRKGVSPRGYREQCRRN